MVSPFLQIETILGISNPVLESGTYAYPRLIKALPIDFLSQKTCRAEFLGRFDF